jgi:hypothetical protein
MWISRCSAADRRLGEAARLAVKGLERGSVGSMASGGVSLEARVRRAGGK